MAKQAKKSQATSKNKQKEIPNALSYKRQWFFRGLVFISALMIYSNTFEFGYSLDDDIYALKNRFVQQGFSALPDIFNKGSLVGFNNANESNYRPLVLLNFMVDKHFFGNNPHFEHKLNVVLFGLSCVLLLLLLQLIFKGYNYYIPLLITLVFVFHPIHTEVVASIKSRDELLGWLFGLSCFYWLMRYVFEPGKKAYLIGAAASFFASILCKENGLTFVVIIPMLLYFFTELSYKKIAQITLPFAVLIVIYFLIRSAALESITFKDKIIVMNNGLMAATTTGSMLATNFLILGNYLRLLFFPVALTWDYSFAQIPIVTFSDFNALISLLLYLGMGAWVIIGMKRKDVFSFCIAFYFITLFLSSNLVVKIGATMGERFLYVPSLGFCIALIFGFASLLKLDFKAVKWKSASTLFAGLAVLFLLYGFKTYDRNKAWANNFELFKAGLEVSTNSARAHFAAASEYRVKGEANPDQLTRMNDFRNSVEEYKKGIAIYKEDAEVWYNLGVTYFDMGDTANARISYAKALEYRPDYSMALNNTGVIFFNAQQYNKALTYFAKILEKDTLFVDAYGNIGAVYHNTGNYKLAAQFYERALKLNANNKNTIKNLATVYRAMGDTVRFNFYQQRYSQLP